MTGHSSLRRDVAVVKLVIAEDDDLLRDALAALVATMDRIEVVATVGDGVEAVKTAGILKPDVILMDVAMPIMDGIEATQLIASKLPECHVLALTSLAQGETGLRMINAGAVGYLTKALRPALLEGAILEAACGRGVVSTDVARTLDTTPAACNVPLTQMEQQVLDLLVEGQGNEEIANSLFISLATAKKHLASLQTKLGATNRVTVVVQAARRGVLDLRR